MGNYEVNLTWNKDRKGLVSSPVLNETIEVVTPPEFGKLDKADGKYMITEVTLRPILVIKNAGQEERAKRVLAMSEKTCLLSNSIKSTVIFEPEIKFCEFYRTLVLLPRFE